MSEKKYKKNILKFSLFFCGLFALVFAVLEKTNAGVMDNVSGWFWGGGSQLGSYPTADGTNTNFGWVSTNSLNCDSNGDGLSEGIVGCPVSGSPVAQYGLAIPLSGVISGYAWSENIGWISFNAADVVGCPVPDPVSGCSATSHGSGNFLTGWARIISMCDGSDADNICSAGEVNANAGGWKGWIKLSGTINDGSGTAYGVTINSSTHALEGYALSASPEGAFELGWLNFNSQSGSAIVNVPTATLSASAQYITLFSGQSLGTLPLNEKKVTLSWILTGNILSCQAVCKSGTCDPVWSGNLALAPLEARQMDIVPQGRSAEYQLNCIDQFNVELPPSVQTIFVGCRAKACSLNSCEEADPLILAVDYNAECLPEATCSSSADCSPRSTGQWKEVSPF